MEKNNQLFFPALFQNSKKINRLFPVFNKKNKLFSKPKVNVFIETNKFIIKTAHSKLERKKAHDLRLKIFSEEFRGKQKENISDWDRFDKKADFLIIIDKEKNNTVGTYRLISSEKAKDFYTSSEFNIEDFIKSSGTKVELSRACVDPLYRKGSVILLLWRGIYNYLQKVNADILFGCSSIANVNESAILQVICFLQNQNYTLDTQFNIVSKSKFDCTHRLLKNLSQIYQVNHNKLTLPPLFRTYLKIGANMFDIPSYDSYYNCYDFFTFFEVDKLNKIFGRKFKD